MKELSAEYLRSADKFTPEIEKLRRSSAGADKRKYRLYMSYRAELRRMARMCAERG